MSEKDLDILDKKDKVTEQSQDSLGFYKVNIKNLPSQGLFYPADVYIGVKPADIKEIRHWSMIDENDDYSFIEAMDFVLGNCCVIKSKSDQVSLDSLVEVDRLYLTLFIRELTFNDGSNKIYIDVPYRYQGEEYKDSVEVTKENVNYFEIPESLTKYYDEAKRAFVIRSGKFEVRLPNVAVSKWVQEYITKKLRNNKPIDEFFAKVSTFIIKDTRGLDDTKYFNMEVDSKQWSIQDISALDKITQIISSGAKEGFTHKTKKGGIEVTVPLKFRDGVKSIFLISDILD